MTIIPTSRVISSIGAAPQHYVFWPVESFLMIGRNDILAGSDSVLWLHCPFNLLQQLNLFTCAGRTLRLMLDWTEYASTSPSTYVEELLTSTALASRTAPFHLTFHPTRTNVYALIPSRKPRQHSPTTHPKGIPMLPLDGSTLEGGGQLVRTALCLSAITSQPIRLYNIRANRAAHQQRQTQRSQYSDVVRARKQRGRTAQTQSPTSRTIEGGLKESHLAALSFLADCTDAKVLGAVMGSRVVDFTLSSLHGVHRMRSKQRKLLPHRVEIALQKPGSVWLVFQAIFPYLVFAGHLHPLEGVEGEIEGRRIELVLRGGTNVSSAMSSEYVKQVFLLVCERIGLLRVDVNVVKRGWAGVVSEVGEVRVGIGLPEVGKEVVLNGFRVDGRGELIKVCVSVVAHGAVRELLRELLLQTLGRWVGKGVEVEVVLDEDSGDERRLYVLLVAHTQGGWRLGRDYMGSGRKAKNAVERSKIVSMAVEKVVRELGVELTRGECVDEYMEDQLVVFQALAQGKSKVRDKEGQPVDSKEVETGTLHTRTVRWVCEEILGTKFDGAGGCEGRREQVESLEGEDADVTKSLAKLNI